MHSLLSSVLFGVVAHFLATTSAFPLYDPDTTYLLDKRTTFAQKLGPKLSPSASIYLPGNPLFDQATDFWQRYRNPQISIVVEVGNEKDVSEAIKLSNVFGLPFLAINTGLGATEALGTVQRGVEIWLHKLKRVEIAADGKSALIGGGVIDKDVVDPLWAAGKQTVTGSAECVGMTGVSLAGGHGFLQGHYGFVSDQWIELTVVLADGSIVKASKKKNPDLFYAMRGAGHNFGIMTSHTHKIYDVPRNTSASGEWYYESYFFSHEQVEDVFSRINDLMRVNQPKELMNYAVYQTLPAVDPDHAVIFFILLYNGDTATGQRHARPFRELQTLGNTTVITGRVPLIDLPRITDIQMSSQICQHGQSILKFPVNIQTFDIPTMRQTFNDFNDLVINEPAYNQSLLLFEQYSIENVITIPSQESAAAWRDDRIVITPSISYTPDPNLDARAIAWGEDNRQKFLSTAGHGLHAYANYAHGDETKEQVYGGRERVRKLQCLKSKWDPKNKFRYFVPLVDGDRSPVPYRPGREC